MGIGLVTLMHLNWLTFLEQNDRKYLTCEQEQL